MPNKSPYKYIRDIKRITKFLERKRSEDSSKCPSRTHVLTLSKTTIVDIPPDPRKRKLSLVQLKTISVAPMDPPLIEVTKLPPQRHPSQDKAFTLEDFMKCIDKADENERRTTQARELEKNLLEFRRLLDLPPQPGFPLSHI